MLRSFLVAFLLAGSISNVFAADPDIALGGNLKSNLLLQQYSPSSAFYAQSGQHSLAATTGLRLTAAVNNGRWSLNADYQLIGAYDETQSGLLQTFFGEPSQHSLPDDRRRWFDLTQNIDASGHTQAVQRLDRLWLGYTTRHTVVRLGRLALSWGNGLFYAPMDIVNPFDPATIDTEYKAGDDMLYVQRLLSSGNDLEAAWVVRRNPIDNNVDSGEATAALRYNVRRAENEYQIMLARSYGVTVLGAGGSRSVGGAVWRADLVLTDADRWRAQLVTNLSHSWLWRDKNVVGSLEYFFNGFGLRGRNYTLSTVISNRQLAARLARGETYSIGRHYAAGGLTVELSPLWIISPTVFANLEGRSALLQLGSQYSLGENVTVLGALTIPIGPDGSEFGGIRNSMGDNFLSRDAALFAQIAWYF